VTEQEIARKTRDEIINMLRHGPLYDTADDLELKWACQEQERLAKMIEGMGQ
jgi:hypothetical protein